LKLFPSLHFALVVAIVSGPIVTSRLVSANEAPRADRSIDSDPLAFFAATVNRTPMQSWGPGAGVYLGRGLVLTAAHVVGRTLITWPKVIVGGVEFHTSTIKEGSFDEVDLTLLSFDDSTLPLRYRMRRNVLCGHAPYPGEEVVTVVPGKIVRSHVMAPQLLPATSRLRFSTVISDVRETGNSGSGVFDLQHECLLGIMSRKISVKRFNPLTRQDEWLDIAKYFVPASVIAGFIPAALNIPRLTDARWPNP